MVNSILCVMLLSISTSDSFEVLIQNGLEYSYSEEYGEAKSCFDEALKLEPENPLGYFVYAGLYRIYSSDFVTDSLLDSFFFYAERTTEKAKALVEKDKNSSWGYYFLGGINMYISSVHIEKGSYLYALGYAEQSMEDITRCLARDEELFDAYLVMGSYEYLKGSFPLWGGYKAKGIEKIRIAAEKSRYSRPIAKNILSLLLQREERCDEAVEEAEELALSYPESRTFLWTLSKAYLKKEDWNRARESFEALLENILAEQSGNTYNIIQAKLALATCQFHQGEHLRALELCDEIIELGGERKKTEQLVNEAKKLRKQALQK